MVYSREYMFVALVAIFIISLAVIAPNLISSFTHQNTSVLPISTKDTQFVVNTSAEDLKKKKDYLESILSPFVKNTSCSNITIRNKTC